MLWIGLVIAFGLLVGGLVVTFGYRHSVLILVVVLAVLIGALVWYIRFGGQEGAGLITPDEVALNNLALTKQYRSSYRLTGRLVNSSTDHTLTSLDITITASDCQNDGADCVVVGEETRSFAPEIPPGQARDVLEQYIFPRFVLQGELKWSHTFSEIQARPAG